MDSINTDLILAIKSYNFVEVKKLLKKGANVNFIDNEGRTPLIYACLNSNTPENIEIIIHLLKLTQNYNHEDNYKNTAIIYFFCNLIMNYDYSINYENIIKLMIECGSDIQKKYHVCPENYFEIYENCNILMLAAASGNIKIIKWIINNFDVDAQDDSGNTALMYNMTNFQLNRSSRVLITKLFIDNGATLSLTNNACQNAIDKIMACSDGTAYDGFSHELDGYLIKNLVEMILSKDNSLSLITLIIALINYNLFETAICIIQLIKKIKTDEITLFLFKTFNHHDFSDIGENFIYYLIKLGADLNHPILEDGRTPFMNFIINIDISQNKFHIIFNSLISLNANVNAQDKTGKTPLIHAVINHRNPLLIQKLAGYSNVNVKDNAGNTALYYAISNYDIESINILVNAGSDLAVRNNEGDTPFLFALKKVTNHSLSKEIEMLTPLIPNDRTDIIDGLFLISKNSSANILNFLINLFKEKFKTSNAHFIRAYKSEFPSNHLINNLEKLLAHAVLNNNEIISITIIKYLKFYKKFNLNDLNKLKSTINEQTKKAKILYNQISKIEF